MVTRRTLAKNLAATPILVLALRAPGLSPERALAQDAPVRIGSKDFTEQLVLGEMYAQLLENAGIPVERRLNLGGTQVAQEALLAGEIDLYPEYTGTGLTVVLGMPIDAVAASSATPGTGDVSMDQRV